MRNRKRNWIIRRIVLGFAVMALVVPAAAQARIDEGLAQSSSAQVVKSGDFGMPRAMPADYAAQRGDAIEVVRMNPRNEVRAGDLIENARLTPRDVSTPQLVSAPGFDWNDAGIGAALALGLVLVGGFVLVTTRRLGSPQTA
jgi:hypothetical protein